MKFKVTSYKPAFIWLFITTVLLCLPGQKFPSFDFFDVIHFDKFIHIFIFFILSALFLLPTSNKNNKLIIITLLSCFYGVLMEFVQKYYIPNRSFDFWDIIADIIGSFLSYALVIKLLQKKKPL